MRVLDKAETNYLLSVLEKAGHPLPDGQKNKLDHFTIYTDKNKTALVLVCIDKDNNECGAAGMTYEQFQRLIGETV